MNIFEEHFENALGTFALVNKLQKTESEYKLFAKDYRDLHYSVRKKKRKLELLKRKYKN